MPPLAWRHNRTTQLAHLRHVNEIQLRRVEWLSRPADLGVGAHNLHGLRQAVARVSVTQFAPSL